MAPVDYVLSLLQLLGFEYVTIDEMDIAFIGGLPSPHRDPFDSV
jgi:PIN domain nuclease of toxin-antitoxin system